MCMHTIQCICIYFEVVQCVVYFFYRACIDTSEEGNLEAGVFLGEYSVTREFASLTPEDQLNISINVHDEGNTLEIVSLCCKCESLLTKNKYSFLLNFYIFYFEL